MNLCSESHGRSYSRAFNWLKKPGQMSITHYPGIIGWEICLDKVLLGAPAEVFDGRGHDAHMCDLRQCGKNKEVLEGSGKRVG